MSFTFKLDWYEFKKNGLPSNELNRNIDVNGIKSGLSDMVDIVMQHNDNANDLGKYRLGHLLVPGVIPTHKIRYQRTCECCDCHPCLEDYIEENYNTSCYWNV